MIQPGFNMMYDEVKPVG